MKKITALLLLAAFLFSSTSLKELVKTRALIRHYCEHRQSGEDVGIISFLIMHYITDDGNPHDDNREEEMPFKSPTTLSCNYSFAAVQLHFITIIFERDKFSGQITVFPQTTHYLKDFSSQIWHPPQLS